MAPKKKSKTTPKVDEDGTAMGAKPEKPKSDGSVHPMTLRSSALKRKAPPVKTGAQTLHKWGRLAPVAHQFMTDAEKAARPLPSAGSGEQPQAAIPPPPEKKVWKCV